MVTRLSRTGARVKGHNEWTELGKTRGTILPPLGPSLVLSTADMSMGRAWLPDSLITQLCLPLIHQATAKEPDAEHPICSLAFSSALEVWLVGVCYGYRSQLLDLLYTSVQYLPCAPTVHPLCTHCVRLGGRDKRKGGPRL